VNCLRPRTGMGLAFPTVTAYRVRYRTPSRTSAGSSGWTVAWARSDQRGPLGFLQAENSHEMFGQIRSQLEHPAQ
jgi:hypothetical protein